MVLCVYGTLQRANSKKTLLGNNIWYWTRSVSFSPDGKTLAASYGGVVYLWHPSTWQLKKTLTGHSKIDRGMSFSPDGKTLAVGDVHGRVRLWNTSTGKHRKTLLAGDPHYVTSLSFSPDGKTLASGSWDGSLLLWELPPPTNAEATVHIVPYLVQSPDIGKQFTVTLDIVDGASVSGYRATVMFDNTALRYIESNIGDYLPAGSVAAQPIVKAKSVKLSAKSSAGSSGGGGTLATLTFEVIAVKASILRLSGVSLTSSDGFLLSPHVESAQIGR